jgi:hypothetical protein
LFELCFYTFTDFKEEPDSSAGIAAGYALDKGQDFLHNVQTSS